MNPNVPSNPSYDLFKFVRPDYIETIIEDQQLYFQHWDSPTDQVIVEKKGGMFRATNLLGTCFSNEDRAFRNMRMWKGFAENGRGMCFWFFHDALSWSGGVAGDLAVAVATKPTAFTNPYLLMDTIKVYKIDNFSGETYQFSDLLPKPFNEEELVSDQDAMLMLNKPTASEFENEVRFVAIAKPGETSRSVSFKKVSKRFEMRWAIFGPEFNEGEIQSVATRIRNKFRNQVFFMKIRSWLMDWEQIVIA